MCYLTVKCLNKLILSSQLPLQSDQEWLQYLYPATNHPLWPIDTLWYQWKNSSSFAPPSITQQVFTCSMMPRQDMLHTVVHQPKPVQVASPSPAFQQPPVVLCVESGGESETSNVNSYNVYFLENFLIHIFICTKHSLHVRKFRIGALSMVF